MDIEMLGITTDLFLHMKELQQAILILMDMEMLGITTDLLLHMKNLKLIPTLKEVWALKKLHLE